VLHAEPPVAAGRKVYLLLTGTGETASRKPIAADAGVADEPIHEPRFDVENVPPGRYLVRLRADGVDSLILRRVKGADRVELDDEQGVVL
jgi:hypothetical protein